MFVSAYTEIAFFVYKAFISKIKINYKSSSSNEYV